MNKIDAYNYLKKSCQHYHTIHIDQLIDDDIQTRFFKRRIHQSKPARKRTIQTWQRKSSFCAEHYLKNFWMAPLLRQQHSSTIYKSVLSRCQTAFAFDFWSFALAFEKYANKLIKTAKLYSTPHTLKAWTI